MKNKNLYSISEVKDLLSLQKDDITLYVFKFPQYFSSECKPKKGEQRKFDIKDICTLSYIHFYWEEEPDIECIEVGLNNNEQFEFPFNCCILGLTSFIRDDFENIDGNSDNYVFFNRNIYNTQFELASQYLDVAMILINDLKNHDDPYLKIFPVMFNLRHSLELYLKYFVKEKMNNDHNLIKIYDQFIKEQNHELGKIFNNFILTINSFDPSSTVFRYNDNNCEYEEYFLDIGLLLKQIETFKLNMYKLHEERGNI